MKIILATHNDKKLEEIRFLFVDTDIEFTSLKELGFNEEIEENGKSFKENAYIKASYIHNLYKLPVISDDSGLEVHALNNEPGIYSARYANGNYDLAMDKIIKRLENKDDRTADFNCSICYIDENDEVYYFERKCYGEIGYEKAEGRAFGYDPIFYYQGKSFATLSLSEKNKISHRGLAFKDFYDFIIKKYKK